MRIGQVLAIDSWTRTGDRLSPKREEICIYEELFRFQHERKA